MSSTKTVGYFNPNRWPVIINISAVGVSATVSPKGYVLDRSGKKVNDPLLEKFVGADMLARETSKTEVELNLFPRPEVLVSSAHHNGVSSSSEVVKDSRGIVQDASFDGVHSRYTGVPTGVTAPSHAVATYTVEEAVKRNIFRPVIIPDDSNAPKETDGQPVRGDNLPPIMNARDATPGEARKLAKAGIVRVESPVEVKKEQVPIVPTDESQEEVDVGGDTGVLDVGAHLKKLNAELDTPTPPVQPPAAPQPAAPKAPVNRPDKFVCEADGRSFKRKGYLLNHVKKHFPAREKELMAPYANEADE